VAWARAAVPLRVTSFSRLLVTKTLRAGHARCPRQRRRGRRLEQHLALGVVMRSITTGCHAPAAVGQHRIGLRHLQRRHAAGAQRQRQVVGLFRRVQPKRRPTCVPVQADLLQQPHADQVLRARQRLRAA
jgi:hypothetical protein